MLLNKHQEPPAGASSSQYSGRRVRACDEQAAQPERQRLEQITRRGADGEIGSEGDIILRRSKWK